MPQIEAAASTAGSKPMKSSKTKKDGEGGGDVVAKSSEKDGKAKRDPSEAARAAPDWIKKRFKKKKTKKKNVGGPVPPEYAKQIQRGWLDSDDTFIPSGSKQFIPQAGDLVL